MAIKSNIKLNEQHDYISLRLPAGTFTTSYSGSKASGRLAIMPGAFAALDNYVQNFTKTGTYGDAMRSLTNPELLDTLVPGWNDTGEVALAVGDNVRFAVGAFTKKYPGTYDVKGIKGKNAVLLVSDRGRDVLVQFPTIYLEKA